MFTLEEVLKTINSCENPIGIDILTKLLCRKHKIIFDYSCLCEVSELIRKNCELFRLNFNNNIEPKKSSKYLYVDDKKIFKYEYEILNTIFGFTYSGFMKGGKYLKNGNFVWFPKTDNSSGWINTYSEDGRYWTEQPISEKAKTKCSKELEKNIRYVFGHFKDGLRFTGVFKQKSIDENLLRTYELIDDKVLFAKKGKLLICNIGYMKYYQGITADDGIEGGHKHIRETKTGGEINNFLKRNDGFTYGFVETNYTDNSKQGEVEFAKKIAIEKIDSSAIGKDSIDGVRVIFISKNPSNHNSRNVIVGWYDNATVYRKRLRQSNKSGSFDYNIVCKNSDSHLIQSNQRIFIYPKKNDEGSENFGQASISYPYSSGKKSTIDLADKVNEYIDNLLESANPAIYYEPVNLLQWPMFEEVSGIGHKEYFLATKEMKIGDLLLLYVGMQKKDVKSGVYAVGKIIETPAILEGYPGDYCNNKLSVLVEIIKFGKECLIDSNNFSKYSANLRSVHKLDTIFYKEIRKILKI